MPKTEDQLPDDDSLKAFIDSCSTPPKLREIARHFGLAPALRPDLRARLHELATNQSATFSAKQGKKGKAEILLIEITHIDSDGTGFAVSAGETEEEAQLITLLPDNKNRRALKRGTRCLAHIVESADGLRGQILRILPAQKTRLFGRIYQARHNKAWMIEPADKGGRRPLPLLAGEHELSENMLIEAEMVKARSGQAAARMLRSLGLADSPQALIGLAIAEFNLPHHFNEEMLQQAGQASLPEKGKRRDIRELPLVTIDGEDAKDFDDAVYAEPTDDGGWHLIVAIADVAHYVGEDSALDREARKRGNSVYLPGTVIPMLPEALSNGLCSLRPNEDRACLGVDIFIDKDGHKHKHQFFRGLMRSSARLTYTQIQAVIDGQSEEKDLGVAAGSLHHLIAVYRLLKKRRDIRGALNLDIAEKKILMDEEGQPTEVTLHRQYPAHQLIEEMMVLANICAAETVDTKQNLCVFRIHEQPDPEKMDHLREVAEMLEVSFPKGQLVTPKRFNELLAAAAGTSSQEAVNDAILRCQARAIYSLDNAGHYGLGLSKYAHFTSPIRRYADLLIHRALIAACKLGPERVNFGREHTQEICAHICDTEHNAAKAERRTVARMAAGLMTNQIGELLEVTITGVTKAGLFAVVKGGIAEGFISRTTLPDDFYDLDEPQTSLTGLYSGWRFSVGETLTCRLTAASSVSGDISLRWHAGGSQSAPSFSSKRRKKRPGRAKSGKNRPRRR